MSVTVFHRIPNIQKPIARRNRGRIRRTRGYIYIYTSQNVRAQTQLISCCTKRMMREPTVSSWVWVGYLIPLDILIRFIKQKHTIYMTLWAVLKWFGLMFYESLRDVVLSIIAFHVTSIMVTFQMSLINFSFLICHFCVYSLTNVVLFSFSLRLTWINILLYLSISSSFKTYVLSVHSTISITDIFCPASWALVFLSPSEKCH